MSTFTRREGSLYLEGLRLSRLLDAGLPTPFYIYSLAELRRCWAAWAAATDGMDALVGYAVKANHNALLLRELARLGAGAIVASDVELRHALACGFAPERMLLHGNGKRPADLDAAISSGVLLSADSPFDLRHMEEAAARRGVRARVLLRVNPDIDPQVHPYISTGMNDAKFGMPRDILELVRPDLRALRHVSVVGLHSHIGSALSTAQPFVDAGRIVLEWAERLRQDGHPISIVDLGGGLGVDYSRRGEPMPTPSDLVSPLRQELQRAGLRLMLEPGRSLVATAGALIGRVVGVKHNPVKSFLVVDASMAQLIRPSLYGAHHHIELLEAGAEPGAGELRRFDIVGPLCESGDFLGLGRELPAPREGQGVIVYDAGAYGFSMASRYNLHLLCAEYVVDGERLILSRRAETYEDFARLFAEEEVKFP